MHCISGTLNMEIGLENFHLSKVPPTLLSPSRFGNAGELHCDSVSQHLSNQYMM